MHLLLLKASCAALAVPVIANDIYRFSKIATITFEVNFNQLHVIINCDYEK